MAFRSLSGSVSQFGKRNGKALQLMDFIIFNTEQFTTLYGKRTQTFTMSSTVTLHSWRYRILVYPNIILNLYARATRLWPFPAYSRCLPLRGQFVRLMPSYQLGRHGSDPQPTFDDHRWSVP